MARLNPSTRTARATHCLQCSKPRTADRTLSKRGICTDCATLNLNRAARELAAKEGPAYDEWRKRWIEAAMREAGTR